MNKIVVPDRYNYIGVFLTFGCDLHCSYCINRDKGARPRYKSLTAEQWIQGLNRIVTRDDLPITLQGGEPTVHNGFYDVVDKIDNKINIDILTNAQFDFDTFTHRVVADRLKRISKYASIRVSWHPEQMSLDDTMLRVLALQALGYSVGVWIVDHPAYSYYTKHGADKMQKAGIDVRIKEFLGMYNDKMYGTYKYPGAVDGTRRKCMCRPSEMLIAPDGGIHRCHSDLYNNREAYANILDDNVELLDIYKYCSNYGLCNGCDIKLKTNRYQEYGHCSVDISEIGDIDEDNR